MPRRIGAVVIFDTRRQALRGRNRHPQERKLSPPRAPLSFSSLSRPVSLSLSLAFSLSPLPRSLTPFPSSLPLPSLSDTLTHARTHTRTRARARSDTCAHVPAYSTEQDSTAAGRAHACHADASRLPSISSRPFLVNPRNNIPHALGEASEELKELPDELQDKNMATLSFWTTPAHVKRKSDSETHKISRRTTKQKSS